MEGSFKKHMEVLFECRALTKTQQIGGSWHT